MGHFPLYWQEEPPSPIQGLGVNPFPIRFINRTVPWGGFVKEAANEDREMTVVLSYVEQQEASTLQKKMVLFINLLGKGLTQKIE